MIHAGRHGRTYRPDKLLPKKLRPDSLERSIEKHPHLGGLPQDEFTSEINEVIAKRHRKKSRQYYKQRFPYVWEDV